MLCIEFGYLMSLTLPALRVGISNRNQGFVLRLFSLVLSFLARLRALITFNLFVSLCFLASLDISAAASFFYLLFSVFLSILRWVCLFFAC